jgi:hypothetical protein
MSSKEINDEKKREESSFLTLSSTNRDTCALCGVHSSNGLVLVGENAARWSSSLIHHRVILKPHHRVCLCHIKQTTNLPVSRIQFAGSRKLSARRQSKQGAHSATKRGRQIRHGRERFKRATPHELEDHVERLHDAIREDISLQQAEARRPSIHPGPFSSLVAFFDLTGAPSQDAIHGIANEMKQHATLNAVHLPLLTYTHVEAMVMFLIHLKSSIPFRAIGKCFSALCSMSIAFAKGCSLSWINSRCQRW